MCICWMFILWYAIRDILHDCIILSIQPAMLYKFIACLPFTLQKSFIPMRHQILLVSMSSWRRNLQVAFGIAVKVAPYCAWPPVPWAWCYEASEPIVCAFVRVCSNSFRISVWWHQLVRPRERRKIKKKKVSLRSTCFLQMNNGLLIFACFWAFCTWALISKMKQWR